MGEPEADKLRRERDRLAQQIAYQDDRIRPESDFPTTRIARVAMANSPRNGAKRWGHE
jgi:hypothetical protein